MDKVSVKLKNCYGISSFEHVFDFTLKPSVKACMLYAPNGSMKSSFARTMQDLSEGKTPKDVVYPDRVTSWEVKNATNQTDILPESIYVVKSQVTGEDSGKISLLLAKEQLRAQYDKIYADIRSKKDDLLKILQSLSGLKKDTETALAEGYKGDVVNALFSMKDEVSKYQEEGLASVQYVDIINDQTEKILKESDFISNLDDYIKTYEELISKSNLFKLGKFDHNNAEDVSKGLEKNKFFDAGHKVSLNTLGGVMEITSPAQLNEYIIKEKKAILQDESLRKKFEEIDKKIAKNENVKTFRAIIKSNPFLITKLSDLQSLKREFWISYLKENESKLNEFLGFYDASKVDLEKIIATAKADVSKWRDVVAQFKKRFHVPFGIKVSNQEDVILKQDRPALEFSFCDGSGKTVFIRKDSLLGLNSTGDDGVLSTGERRALYILNIIFEVEARRLANAPTLMVVDDIADSFDYRNKYAIVEYLRDIVRFPNFRVIILTHNFDFFRTCFKRVDLHYNACMQVEKNSTGIKLVGTNFMNKVPLQLWKDKLHSPNERIAAIPFVRNLIEYRNFDYQTDSDYLLLTSLLHIKPDSSGITFGMLKAAFDRNLKLAKAIDFKNDDAAFVMEEIFISAKGTADAAKDIWSLEEKIVVSIACRLKAEQAMLAYIAKANPAYNATGITSNQTTALYDECKSCLKVIDHPKLFEILERVLLMTTENIHLNAFMYEPIIDLGSEHLKTLYNDLCSLTLPA
jgi:hypothetical protein